ncbi:MAG: 5-methyltetrahydropteroyltriglutamate--homocysteine S-methyltransferase [Corynebacterium sp.]|uniref:5-methyltetrahydropteroyltriglutamate-- homocysteine S-methyltransferase n=1 Tax=Corynebacterium sp. TaxID=1720 RepID=UPI0026DD2A90|nr:5-methyltetrahydropteroyltriglutamate--homocysteine S-methyltransferase [Corynebacterium sp.]MDO4760896.1 5-methyltetrahydropteroyltriglutamate--homocysteine S-methyltransferase [Corynebacterium sp.]
MISATVTSVPRIGPNRELKKALEGYWNDSTSARELATTATRLHNQYTDALVAAGCDSFPTLGRSYYDQILDLCSIFDVLPERVQNIPSHPNDGLPADIDRYFATARGTAEVAASAMTKWFDTNYHYIVPELSRDTVFKVGYEYLADIREQAVRNPGLRPVLIGPVTFLALSKSVDGSDLFDLLPELTQAYARLISRLARTEGVDYVQLDEPILVTDFDRFDLARETYTTLAEHANLVVATYFGCANRAIEALSGTGVKGFIADLVTSPSELPAWTGEEFLLAGVVDGRNVWRTDLHQALKLLRSLAARGPVGVSTSCSLLHVPYSLENEQLDEHLRSRLAFGAEKIAEVATLAQALKEGTDLPGLEATTDATATRSTLGRNRTPLERRRQAQEDLGLPPLPTTTIGSFPQTPEIRRARAQLVRGEITAEAYDARMLAEIEDVIARQEALGLDVLVHGEPERNDMVQYFSEQLEGYHATSNGWVQSYGSRCVRPPILFGDVSRPAPMTVRWYEAAQKLTDKPVKGMLTGPVTMLAWSFVRNDQPLAVTADQVAEALREEILDLEKAGARIIQVDEPAIRELLPLRKQDHAEYLEWAVGSFRLATAGVKDSTQIHTHMCYSSFNELIDTVIDLDADVTSIEAARNGMGVLAALKQSGFHLGVGPGVWDIHSPRVPSQEEVDDLVSAAVNNVDPALLWINPDCGLKTRKWPEVEASLKVLVTAARNARAQLV